ncbi:unknown [Clostridium sp. CAG:813]|nr:unknown [Clostridium sp. CAG:813]
MTKSNKSEHSHYMNGLIVKSGYNIDSEKGFYLVNMDGVSALVGRIKDDIFILKKFNYVVDKPLQVRQDYGSVYIVKAGGFKCLVDVAKDKMGTLIEI